LVICHIESSVSQLSLFSLFSIISPLWIQFWASVGTKNYLSNDKIKSTRRDRVWCPPFLVTEEKFRFLRKLLNAGGVLEWHPSLICLLSWFQRSWLVVFLVNYVE
jgi:hypothetical protein